jgi:hypothetical protein
LRKTIQWSILFLLVSVAMVSRADVGLFMEQPYGKLGVFSPTGHAAIYLSRVCAASSTRLRRCRPPERGVVISRYNRIGHYDWVAIPLLPYLYAVDSPSEIPATIDEQGATQLRARYRRAHLKALAPDGRHGKTPKGEWVELVGSAYRRTIYVYEIQTSPAQDDRLIRELNARPNRRMFNFFFRNCANFSEAVLNFYFPHSVHRSFSADLGLTTPKQIAKSLVYYGQHQNELKFSTFVIPQVPGTIRRSGKIRGVVEGLLKSKQYAIPLVVWQPYLVAALAGTYLTRGRFDPARNSVVLDPNDEVQALVWDAKPNPPARQSSIESTALTSGGNRPNDCHASRDCGGLPADAAADGITEK